MYGGFNPLLGNIAGAHSPNDGNYGGPKRMMNDGAIDKTPACVGGIVLAALGIIIAMKVSGFRAVVGIGGA